ncbi:MAG: polymer-forming cytoskeletal protein [Deltaproteobacteria bacterium]|nr:polymer-forming cytoskeletal protein [Deltaproteobacteria bacterium]MBW2419486.1 polymer-forming cytoskeletal protein [Deltaproteobacteria bacterium]
MEPSTKPAWTRRLLRTPDAGSEIPELVSEQVAIEPAAVVVEPGCALDGRLVTERLVRIEGDFRGSIETSAGVVIEESGSVVGDIQARSVTIRGAVVGDVAASREVLLKASGRLQGDVVTSSFELVRGGYFNGRTQMLRPQDWSRRMVDSPAPGAQV